MNFGVTSSVKFYEMVFLISGTMGTSGVENMTRSIEGLLVENNLKVLFKNYAGLFDLKYLINRNNRAHYVIFYVESNAKNIEGIRECERKIKLNALVIRHLFLSKKKFDSEKDTGVISMSDKE